MMKNIYEILNNGKSKKHLLLGNGFSIAANALKQSRICVKINLTHMMLYPPRRFPIEFDTYGAICVASLPERN